MYSFRSFIVTSKIFELFLDTKYCIYMLLLHAILQPKGSLNAKNKITIELSKDSFFIHIFSENDLKRKIAERAEFYKQINSTVQPYIIAVGVNVYHLDTYFVILDQHFFKFTTFLNALDICFKSHFVFNLKFAKECQYVWTFIQNYFYDIELKEDSSSPNIISLIADLK